MLFQILIYTKLMSPKLATLSKQCIDFDWENHVDEIHHILLYSNGWDNLNCTGMTYP